MSCSPFPARDDRAAWTRWWAGWNATNTAAATADLVGGLDPAPDGDDLPPGVVPLSVAIDEAFARIAERQNGGAT